MQSAQRNLLLPDAFTPVDSPKAAPNFISELYSGQEAVYVHDEKVRGTLKENEDFTPRESKILDTFHAQFSVITQQLKQACVELKIEGIDLTTIDTYTAHFCSRKYFAGQTRQYYNEIKKAFEDIVYHLKNNSILSQVSKVGLMKEFLTELETCGTGIFNLLHAIKRNLSTDESVEGWVAKFRLTIIKQIAAEFFTKKELRPALLVHVENVFLTHAITQGLNPYDSKNIESLNEIHENLTEITTKDKDHLITEFYNRFTPLEIMTVIADTLLSLITERLKKKLEHSSVPGTIIVRDQVEIDELFSCIPIVSDKQMGIAYVFDEKPTEVNSPSFTLNNHGEIHYYLKTREKIRHSLLKKWANTDGRRFFKCIVDDFYLLVPNNPLLSCRHSEENLENLGQITPFGTMVIDHLPLFSELFQFHFNRGRRDFSQVILYQIDFSKCNLESVNFNGAQFIDCTLTALQFNCIYLRSTDKVKFENLKGYTVTDNLLAEQSPASHYKRGYLIYAITIGDVESIKRMLAKELDRWIYRSAIVEAMTIAFRRYDWKSITILATIHAESDYEKRYYGEIVCGAASTNQLEAARALIEGQADVNYKSNHNTALHLAAANNHESIVQLLLEHKADTNQTNENGLTAIHIAATHWHWNIVELFCQNSPDPENRKQHVKVVTLALQSNRNDIALQLLRRGINVNYIDVTGISLLHFAAFSGYLEFALELLKFNANQSALTILKEPLKNLLLSALADSQEKQESLIYLAYLKPKGVRAIDLAACCGHWDIVNALLPNNVDQCEFLLLCAFEAGQVDVVQRILALDTPSKLNFPYWGLISPYSQFTFLHFSAYHNRPDLIKSFISKGADTSFLTALNKTPIEIAAEMRHWDSVSAFIEYDKKHIGFKIALRIAAENNQTNLVEQFWTALKKSDSLSQQRYIKRCIQRKYALEKEVKERNEDLFINLNQLDPYLRTSFQRLAAVIKNTPEKQIIVDHFNEILRQRISTMEGRALLYKQIYQSQHKLNCKLINSNPSTDTVINALTAFFYGTVFAVFCVNRIAPHILFAAFGTAAVPLSLFLTLGTLVLMPMNRYRFYQQSALISKKIAHANATQPLENVYDIASRVIHK